jgi:hypothetical protein
MPLDGDLATSVLISEYSAYKPLMNDPFGFGIIARDTSWPNPNRFFGHWFLSVYMRHVPLILQAFASPINSVYLACAIIKTLIQVAFIYLLAGYISGKWNVYNRQFILAAILITPLLQASGYNSYMGIIDQSITYTFFYALPLCLLLLFYLPFFVVTSKKEPGRFSVFTRILLSVLVVILSFSGPLIPAIAILCSVLAISLQWRNEYKIYPSENLIRRVSHSFRSLPLDVICFLGVFAVLSCYSLYIGSHNSFNALNTMSLQDEYTQLPIGFYYQFTEKAGFPMILGILALNAILIRIYFWNEDGKRIIHWMKWLSVFSLIYFILLPLGGYRIYRPHILRYDTVMPVTLCLFFLFGSSTLFMLRTISHKKGKIIYSILIISVLLIFTRADEPRFRENACERKALHALGTSPDSIVFLQQDCPVMSWGKTLNYKDSGQNAELLAYWGVTKVKKLYFQR